MSGVDKENLKVKAKKPNENGSALQIIKINMNNGGQSTMTLNVLILKEILELAGDREVAVISVVGPSRTGKSFMLCFMVLYLQHLASKNQGNWIRSEDSISKLKGFPYRNGYEIETAGIHLWSHPFFLKKRDGSEVAIFLMDTQGVYDHYTSDREWSGIIGLALSACSCLIYNVKNIEENMLQSLANFLQFAQYMAHSDSNTKSNNIIFQRLAFLIRDWCNPDEYNYGPLGGQQYADTIFKKTQAMHTQSIELRKIITESFEHLNCFLLPVPGEKALSLDFTGSNYELAPTFINNVKLCVEAILSEDNLDSKTMAGSKIRGRDLVAIMQHYVKAYNSNNGVMTMNTWSDTVGHATCSVAKEKAIETFNKYLEDNWMEDKVYSKERISNMKSKAKQLAENVYSDEKKLGSEAIAKKYKKELNFDIEDEFKKFGKTRKDNIEQLTLVFISQAVTVFTTFIQTNIQDLASVSDNNLMQYLQQARQLAETELSKLLEEQPELLNSMLPQLAEKLGTIENEIGTKRNELIAELTQILYESISPCVGEYNQTMTKLLQTQKSLVTDEQLRQYDEISRKQARSVALIPNSLSGTERIQMFQENLKTKLNNAFDEFVERNSKLWDANNKQIIQRIEQLTDAVVHSFNNKIANNSIVTMEQLADLFADETAKVNQEFQTSDIFKEKTLGELEHYNLNLRSRMDAALKSVKEYLVRHRAQIQQDINGLISKAVTTYTSSFKQRLDTDGVMSEAQLRECHNQLRKNAFLPQMPDVTPEQRDKYYSDLKTQLEDIFKTMKLKNELNCQEAWKHIELWCIKVTKNHQEALLKFGSQQLFKENELRLQHEALIKRAQFQTLQEIAKFGKYLQSNLMDKVYNSLNQIVEEVVLNYRNEQTHQNSLLVSIQRKVLLRYDVKMNENCGSRLNQDKISIKNYHKLNTITALDEFDEEVNKKNIKSSDLTDSRNNLSRDIEEHFDIRLRNMEMISQNIKDIKEQRYERYQEAISDYVKRFPTQIALNARHKELKTQQLEAFDALTVEAERGTVNIAQLKLSLSEQIQTYYEQHIEPQFNSLVREHRENVTRVIENVKECYSNEMNKMLSGDCIVLEENKLRDYHSKAYVTAIKEFKSLTAQWEEQESRSVQQEVEDKINKEFKDLILRQANILDELKETAGYQVDMSVQKYEDEIMGYASTLENVENFENKVLSLMENHLTQFKNTTTLPWQSLIDEFVGKLNKRLRAEFEKRNKELQHSVLDMKVVQMEIRGVIPNYKTEMLRLLDGKIVEENELLIYHLKAVESAKAILVLNGVNVTGSVEESLKDAVKPAFKKFSDDNNKNASITSNSPAVGVDLGTTFSCIALYTHNGVVVISNNNAEKTTPSYVMFGTNGKVVHVGKSAKELAHEDPSNTIFDVKRLIGKKFDDPIVQGDMKLWPFQVISDNGVPKIKLDSEETESESVFPPEQISASVLSYLKKSAEDYLGKEVKRAVITVPANFNDGQRQATRDAGEIAGFEVLGIINEPTAAAIAYNLQYDEYDEKNVLVYDFGGGTFDVSVLKMKGGKIDVLSTDGDTHLGGQDIDNALMSYCVEEFRRQTEFDAVKINANESIGDINKRNRRLRRLRNKCEQSKCHLSGGCPSVTICVDVFTENTDLHVEVTREKFEEISNNIFEKTMSIVTKAVQAAGLTKANIDDVVLVGGSTKIPKVQQMLKDEFPNKGLKRTVNPDEAVAFGAAIHAAILNNQWDNKSKQISLSDVTPTSIGIEVSDGSFSVIVKKNTTIPTVKTEEYVTAYHNQKQVRIDVFEGENEIAERNHKLGEFRLDGIPPGKAGSQTVTVTIKIDLDGILHVQAVCVSTGGSTNLTIQASKGRLTKEEIKRCRELASC